MLQNVCRFDVVSECVNSTGESLVPISSRSREQSLVAGREGVAKIVPKEKLAGNAPSASLEPSALRTHTHIYA